jgi:uncharacterized protein YjdB
MKKQLIYFLTIISLITVTSCEEIVTLFHDEKPIDTSVAVTGLSLNMTNTDILVGKAETLIAVITPDNATNKAVKWRSSNDAVATVENGVVTGLTAGSADIIVTTVNGNKTATCAVTVSADVVAVTGVTLNKASTTLTVGITEKLFANISPSDATNLNVNWSSDKPAVASVTQDGEVTGVSVGSAEITVTTVDDNKTAKCVVTVSATSVAVTSVSLNKQNISIAVNSSETIIATVRPTNATNQNVTWESEDPAIVTVTDGIVIGKSVGLTVITVKTVDQGKTANCIVTVTAPVNPTYSISLSSGGGSLTNHTFPGATQGYGAQTALTVTVQNTGNQATGTLFIERSGSNSDSFTISTSNLGSIADGGSGTFTVAPKTGLASGKYSATITVSGGNGISAQFDVSFAVTADVTPTYEISLSGGSSGILTSHTFPDASKEYGIQTPLTVIVQNTGNQATGSLTITCSGANSGSFTLSTSSLGSIADGGSGTFTVTPNTGLTSGTYSATITVSGGNGISAQFIVNFTVTSSSVSVSAVTLNNNTLVLDIGGTETLIATITPTNATNKTVTWSSSAPSVATVSPAGVVTGIASGNATIIIVTTDGGKTATCSVAVTTQVPQVPIPAAPTGVTAKLTSTRYVTITWKASSGATSYDVYYAYSSSSSVIKNLIGNRSGTSCSHPVANIKANRSLVYDIFTDGIFEYYVDTTKNSEISRIAQPYNPNFDVYYYVKAKNSVGEASDFSVLSSTSVVSIPK